MLRYTRFSYLNIFVLCLLIAFSSCRTTTPPATEKAISLTPLDAYVAAPDSVFQYEILDTVVAETHKTYVIRMTSQKWLTTAEVDRPIWWHWLTMVVPNDCQSETGMLFIGGGSHNTKQPGKADELAVQAALAARAPVANLHNVPNQPLTFVNDTFGPRVEDELIAYGWRQFLEGGGKDADAKWLARLPMTKSAVRAMDVMTKVSQETGNPEVSKFVVAGGSKRGWTTWTTAVVDKRVVAIAPIVIDMLNVVPSFEHHWRAYGFWAPAVGNYVHEGIMDWQHSQEYAKLISLTEPFSYKDRLTLPKLLINATGDQFFLPDSWQFYWDDLKGEKHMRYVPNSEHSLRGTDALGSLVSFFQHIVHEKPRPDFDWEVKDGKIHIQTQPGLVPAAIKLWRAENPDSRDFRVETIDRSWESKNIEIREDGSYVLSIDTPEGGYAAFFGELTFEGIENVPLKMTTGIVVTPDTYPHSPYVANPAKGQKIAP